MNLNEECLLKYLQNPDELFNLTALLAEYNLISAQSQAVLADVASYSIF